jgi:hypothetical protein
MWVYASTAKIFIAAPEVKINILGVFMIEICAVPV